MVTYINQIRVLKYINLYSCTIELILEDLKCKLNLTPRNKDPMHVSLALSSLLRVWHKSNSHNNKPICNTLLLDFYICENPKLINWYSSPPKGAITFAQRCNWVASEITALTLSTRFSWHRTQFSHMASKQAVHKSMLSVGEIILNN